MTIRTVHIQLFRERLSEKNVHPTITKGNMGYDHYIVSWHCCWQTYFCCFPLALANIRPWLLVLRFQISLKKSEHKNHPQYLSELSRALFPTTFFEIAVYYDIVSIDNYSTSARWTWVGYNHLISNKREWNNCFVRNALKISRILPNFICKNNRFSACL